MNTVLFDLDGTLLPIDMKEFIDTYVELMTGFLKSNDLNPDDIVPSIWKATGAMEVNDGLITNEELFWKVLMEDLASKDEKYDEKFRRRFPKKLDKFYKGDFQMIRYMVRPSQSCHDAVMMLKEKGYRVVLATKPMFPEIAVNERLSWLGFSVKDFDYVYVYDDIPRYRLGSQNIFEVIFPYIINNACKHYFPTKAPHIAKTEHTES